MRSSACRPLADFRYLEVKQGDAAKIKNRKPIKLQECRGRVLVARPWLFFRAGITLSGNHIAEAARQGALGEETMKERTDGWLGWVAWGMALFGLLLGTAALADEPPVHDSGPQPLACTVTCDAGPSVSAGQPPLDVTFLSTTTVTGCDGPVSYEWKLDGNVVSNAATFTTVGT